MASRNTLLRDIQRQQRESLSDVEEMLRDLDALLSEPKPVPKRLPNKYLPTIGSKKDETDESFNASLRQMGPRNVGQAFGSGMSIADYCNTVLSDLVAQFGSDKDILPYLELAVQVLGAAIATVARGETQLLSARANLKKGAEDYVKSFAKSFSIKAALGEMVKVAGGKVYNAYSNKIHALIEPINYTYVEMAETEYYNTATARDAMSAFIATQEARNAATLYISKERPSNKVLVPAAIAPVSGNIDDKAVNAAFAKYPDKDKKSTYEYYRDAVKHYMESEVGLTSVDVHSSLKGIANALGDAKNAVSMLPIRPEYKPEEVKRFLRSELDSIEREVSNLKVNAQTQAELVRIATMLVDLVDGIEGWGTNSAAYKSGKLDGFDTSNLGQKVLAFANDLDRGIEDMLSVNPYMYSVLDAICPTNTGTSAMRPTLPGYSNVQEALSIAFYGLQTAYDGLVSVSITPPAVVGSAVYKVSEAFEQFVVNILNSSLTSIRTKIKAAAAVIDKTAVDAGLSFAITQLAGLVSTFDIGTADHKFVTAKDYAGSSDKDKEFTLRADILRRIAEGTAPTLSGTAILQRLDDKMNDLMRRTPIAKRESSLRLAKRAISEFDAAMDSAREQALTTSEPIMVRANPAGDWNHGWKRGVKIGGMSVGGVVVDHGVTSALSNLFSPEEHNKLATYAVDLGPSVALGTAGALLMHQRPEHKDVAISMVSSAIATVGARMLAKSNAFRFSDNAFVKALQYPTNGVASLLGDQSMAASTVTPADVSAHQGHLGEYICKLVKMNDREALCHIAVQLWKSGLFVGSKDATRHIINLTASSKVLDAKAALVDGNTEGAKLAPIVHLLCMMKCITECCGSTCYTCNGNDINFKGITGEQATACTKAIESHVKDMVLCAAKVAGVSKLVESSQGTKDLVKLTYQAITGTDVQSLETLGRYVTVPTTGRYVTVPTTGGFILEPGYENLDVYSGEDRTTYLQPAPIQTSQPGMTQLEDAIARARKLTPSEKMQEGIDDITDVSVIRASSQVARQIEQAGKGVSLGQSRLNPNTELVALQVEGDNGLWPTAPARQYSVPQGALTHSKIGPAPQADVSPYGLFNHGVFTPKFGR